VGLQAIGGRGSRFRQQGGIQRFKIGACGVVQSAEADGAGLKAFRGKPVCEQEIMIVKQEVIIGHRTRRHHGANRPLFQMAGAGQNPILPEEHFHGPALDSQAMLA
jgi:hypothetical protein